MRLIATDCMNYKRLRTGDEMDLGPSLVCIVGPNEAGKSSFLDAMVHLDHDEEFLPQEKTRGAATSDTIQVRARFLLDDDDKALIADIPEAGGVRQLVQWKRDTLERGRRLDPAPTRDRAPRHDVQNHLQRLRDAGWPQSPLDDDEIEDPSTADLLDQALAVTENGAETLDEADEVGVLVSLLERLQRESVPHAHRGLPDRVEQLIAHERVPDPHTRALAVLIPRIPRFMKFGQDERGLKATYTLGAENDPALENLLRLAGTDYAEATAVASGGDRGRKTVWLDRTRDRLRDKFSKAWKQSDLTVRFDLDGPVLSILMSMQAEDFIAIDQRSDGLRQFVALRSYVALARDAVKPVLLIDEADTHLHYDAQADLIQVLEEQQEVAKVVYTTHSAGCLPRDLGTGIRAIVPTYRDENGEPVQTDDSEIVNRFWTRGRGFSPILIAMGASALAFSATRRAVIAEGMSDTLLLPTLIREALDADKLGYQVAPSFAEASSKDVVDLDLVAARVAYVADGDKGGRDHAKKLRKSGVLDDQILFLGGEQSGLSTEDLLVKEVYLNAVNDELSRRHGLRMSAKQIPDTGRSAAVAKWCARHKPDNGQRIEISKVDVAQRVLDQRNERQLLAPQRRQMLRELDRQLSTVLNQATQTLARS